VRKIGSLVKGSLLLVLLCGVLGLQAQDIGLDPMIADGGADDWREFDEQTILELNSATQSMQSFVESSRPNIDSPAYLSKQQFQEGMRCGPNALFVLLRYLGIQASYDEIISRVEIGERGSSLNELARVAEQFSVGLEPRGQIPPEAIAQLPVPSIVLIDTPATEAGPGLDHYMVFCGVDSKSDAVLAIDPTNCSYYELPRQSFARTFTGNALVVSSFSNKLSWRFWALWLVPTSLLTLAFWPKRKSA
jgi:predicted double-glycine peptidase